MIINTEIMQYWHGGIESGGVVVSPTGTRVHRLSGEERAACQGKKRMWYPWTLRGKVRS